MVIVHVYYNKGSVCVKICIYIYTKVIFTVIDVFDSYFGCIVMLERM